MNKYDALIAEADLYDNRDGLMGAPGSQNALVCDLISRLATALREAQAHVPPPGWRVTEYTREDGAWTRDEDGVWTAGQETDLQLYDYETDAARTFPTAAAAMAAIEEAAREDHG